MKSIIEWKEEDVFNFLKQKNLSFLSNNLVSGLNGLMLLKLTNRELKDEFKLKYYERQTFLNAVKQEELRTSK